MSNWETLKCLVIDDSSTMRRIIAASLARCGLINVTEVGDGHEAMEKLQTENFNLILTDWNMPGYDGLELVKRIRQMPNYKNTPIIMITTEQRRDDVLAAMKNGVSAYIVKPFTPDIIRSKLEAVLPPRNAAP